MNDERRKKLSAILSTIEQAKADLEEIKDAEQEAYDAIPESLQSGERGEKGQAAIDALESADSSLDEVIGYIETAKE